MHSARSDLRRDGGVTVSLAIWLGWLVRSRRMGGQIAPPASAETVEILEMRSSAPGQFKAPAPQVARRRSEQHDQCGNSGYEEQHSHLPRQIGEQDVDNGPTQRGGGHDSQQ
jgi:hypothetical protein